MYTTASIFVLIPKILISSINKNLISYYSKFHQNPSYIFTPQPPELSRPEYSRGIFIITIQLSAITSPTRRNPPRDFDISQFKCKSSSSTHLAAAQFSKKRSPEWGAPRDPPPRKFLKDPRHAAPAAAHVGGGASRKLHLIPENIREARKTPARAGGSGRMLRREPGGSSCQEKLQANLVALDGS